MSNTFKLYCDHCKGTGRESYEQSPCQDKCTWCDGLGFTLEEANKEAEKIKEVKQKKVIEIV